MSDTRDRPVLTGLIALVAVAAVVGIVGGLAALVGTKALGLDGGGGRSDSEASSGTSLYLPEPTITSETTSPEAGASPTSEPVQTSTAPATTITLSAGQETVAAMQEIDLSGTYPTGEGAILQVQRLENGKWTDFPVTMSVNGQDFATYVLTSRVGENQFRVIDTDKGVFSNEVVVTVG
ncbi:MAG: hypothetical protein JWN68_1791 [Nocardioides sp.]|uniref:hypothetical protein n=1 Tax=Nocardioides sp. TaxID=35761 RepID=UPI0026066459|nr:hypothetical protein [Nocardioides sp.]MCW2833838.1 hypothetical protein [Nocardioides sp.]